MEIINCNSKGNLTQCSGVISRAKRVTGGLSRAMEPVTNNLYHSALPCGVTDVKQMFLLNGVTKELCYWDQ